VLHGIQYAWTVTLAAGPITRHESCQHIAHLWFCTASCRELSWNFGAQVEEASIIYRDFGYQITADNLVELIAVSDMHVDAKNQSSATDLAI